MSEPGVVKLKQPDGVLLARMQRLCRRQGVTIHDKHRSVINWTIFLISFMWLWKPKYMTHVTTVLGSRIYASLDRQERSGFWRVLAHELVHVSHQRSAGKFKYLWSYGGAQWLLMLLALIPMTIWTSWGWLGVFGLIGAVPWPCRGRAEIELRGFRLTYTLYQAQRELRERDRKWWDEIFLGAPYYWMSRDRKWVNEQWNQMLTDAFTRKIWQDPAYQMILKALQGKT